MTLLVLDKMKPVFNHAYSKFGIHFEILCFYVELQINLNLIQKITLTLQMMVISLSDYITKTLFGLT